MSYGKVSGSEHIYYRLRMSTGDPHEALRNELVRLITFAATSGDQHQTGFSVLDAGCGPGELLADLRATKVSVVGFDNDPQCLDMASEFAPCEMGDITAIQHVFEQDSFDLVVCSHVLEHIPNPQETVKSLSQISKKWLLFAVPNLWHLPLIMHGMIQRDYHVMPGHMHGWDRAHFRNFLENRCGLQIKLWGSDLVQIVPQRSGSLRRALTNSSVLPFIEQRGLPRVFPYFTHSLIALCEKPKTY